jgi:hypothetical protein
MDKVTVRLTSAWPTEQGLRRPLEGPIDFPLEDAMRIVENGCGEIIDKSGQKLVKAAKAAAAKEAAENEAAAKAAAEQEAAEKDAAEKEAAEISAQT